MTHDHIIRCTLCGSPVVDDGTISEDLIVSKNIIFVSGIPYHVLEKATRSVFSNLPSDFKKISGACFAKYRSGGCHNYDFTLVVTGEGNENSAAVLRELLSRGLTNLVAFGRMTREEENLVTGGEGRVAKATQRHSSVGVEDWDEYLDVCMRSALLAVAPLSTL